MAIELKNVKKSFGKPPSEVIKDVSFRIEDGEFVSLTGKSGSGKSTLLYLISSLDNPTGGSILVDDKDLSAMSPRELHSFRNRHMGFVFQFHYLLPEFTALENVLMPLVKAGGFRENRERAEQLLIQFDLADKMNHYPSQLSGGQMQRVAIARALIMQPRYLFADEPTGALDSVNAGTVMNIFRQVNKEYGTAVVLVTHDSEFAASADRQIHLADGRLMKGKL